MSNKTILVVGGTGSFGSAYVDYLLSSTNYNVRVLSRDEHRQLEMRRKYPAGPRMTYVLCDIRDRAAVDIAMDGIWGVVHSAALKTVESATFHFEEVVKTNIIGTMNVIGAARDKGVSKFLFIGTDKAVNPKNNYGFSKGTGERLVIDFNQKCSSTALRLFAVRGGNVWASRGSVALLWKKAIANNESIAVTNKDNTRFHVEMKEWVSFCHRVLENAHGGEVFIPKISSWRLGDLAIAFEAPVDYLKNDRDEDKMHESLIGEDETCRVVDIGWSYVLEPPKSLRGVWNYESWQGFRPDTGWTYTSDKAEKLPVEYLRKLVSEL